MTDRPAVEGRFAGPWPLVSELVRAELASYLRDARAPNAEHLRTRCPPWTVRDVTTHLSETFRRFSAMLDQSRRGDFTPPFAAGDISEENLKRVNEFSGDPFQTLPREVEGFLGRVNDASEPMAHQHGVIPAGLQVLFGLSELALHHDDVADATGKRYRPGDEAVRALAPVWDRVLGLTDQTIEDPWQRILEASGR